jgi:ribosomal protein L18E
MKEFYSELKNHILSYDGVKSRLSWKFDSYNRGRDQLFKIKIRGKTICLYLALDPNNYDVSKYHHESIDAKIFEDVPMLFKIKSGLGLRKAKQLVDDTMAKFEIPQAEKPKFVDYVAKYPYTETEELVQQKLVKVLVSEGSIGAKSDDNADSADVEGDLTTTKVEETVVAPVEEVVEAAPVAEATEEIHIVESVSADEADSLVADEIVDKTVESDVEYVTKKDTKKDVVNVGELSDAYNAGEVVDLKSLKEKGLIDPKTKTLKVLASGTINKPLIVKAHVFSETALKMIVLTGGRVIKVTSKIK